MMRVTAPYLQIHAVTHVGVHGDDPEARLEDEGVVAELAKGLQGRVWCQCHKTIFFFVTDDAPNKLKRFLQASFLGLPEV
jgi:hypothetical protein